MFDYLGENLEHACSESAAETMAARAFERALVFCLTDESRPPLLGISCTAALKTNRERIVKDRAFIWIKSRKEQLIREVEIDQGSRSEQEEKLTAEFLKTISEFLGNDAE